MKRSIIAALMVAGLFCALPGTQAKQFRKPPSQVVEWPLPWASGVSLDYDQSSERVVEVKGVGSRVTSSEVTRIAILREEKSGFVQGWTTLAVLDHSGDESIDERRLRSEIEEAFGKTTLEVSLARDGTYAGIANMEELQRRFKALAVKWRDAARARSGPGKETAQERALRERLFSAYTSGPVLETQLSILPQAYNFVAGGGLGLDYEYKYEDEGANPFGGEAFPMTGRMSLSRDPLHEGWMMLEWTVGVDRERGGEVLAATVRKLKGTQAAQGEDKPGQPTLEQATGNIDIGSSTRFRIDPATGIVQWMQTVQRRRVGQRNEVLTTTLQLRKEKFVAPAAGTAVAEETASVPRP